MKNKMQILVMFMALAVAPGLFAQPAPPPMPGSQPLVFFDESSSSSYLGVETQDISSDRVGQLHLKEERGVEVTMVDQDAPAGKAGLKEHDVILSINDQPVESVEQLRRLIREIPAGRTITVGISRDGQPMTLKAQVAERKKMDMDNSFNFTIPPVNIPAIHIPPINMPEMDFGNSIVVIHSLARSGLMLENLTPQLSEFFGVKNGTGVLVRSVEKGSRAEQAGFRAGDVVVKINGAAVSDCSDFTRILRKRTDNKASVTVLRDRKEQTLTLTLPQTRRTGAVDKTQVCESEDWGDCAADLKDEVAQLVPELNTAELRRMQPEMEKMKREVQKEIIEHQKEFKKEMVQMHKNLRRQQEELKEQLKNWVKEGEI